MDNGFKLIKKKKLGAAVLAGCVFGISAGLAAVGATMLILKLCKIDLFFVWYLVIGVLTAAVCGVTLFLILRPSDKKLAKKLDDNYGLQEKVQTMLSFDGKEGEMLELQRRDAGEKIANLPKEKGGFKKWWKVVVVPVLAVCLCAAAIIIPSNVADGDDEVIYNVTDWQKNSLTAVIENVESSSLSDGLKEEISDELNSLLQRLDGKVTESGLRISVVSAVMSVDDAVAAENTYKTVCVEFAADDQLKTLSEMIVDGITLFNDGSPLNNYDRIKQRGQSMKGDISESFTQTLIKSERSLRATFNKTKEDGFSDDVSAMTQKLDLILIKIGNGTDPLIAAVDDFSADMKKVAANTAYSDEVLQEQTDSAFTTFASKLTDAVGTQSYNCLMDEYIRAALAGIFGLSEDEFPALSYGVGSSSGSDTPNPGEDNPGSNPGGGIGDGDKNVASDDVVFIPGLGYVKYGKVLQQYLDDLIAYEDEGMLPEDMIDAIWKYFTIINTPKEQK